MKKSHRKPLALFSLMVVGLFLLVGCSENSSNTAKFSNTDLMFAEMMIPHHEQAIEMSELALINSESPEIVALARKIKAAQAPEIEEMKLWIDSEESESHMGHGSESEDHSGHGMMGMLDEGQMSELERATGEEFDRLFLKGMIVHHEGAIDMAEMVVDSANAEAAALGRAIIDSQSAEIEEMKTLLAAIS
jgi:uncharacterized protein (DUF305 family)